MIYDASTLPLPAVIDTDLVVVGTGPGGSMAAMVAAEAGLRVVMLEAGSLVTPAMMTQREEEMIPRLLWHSGARTNADRSIHIHQGHGVGGSSLHNLNLVKRTPDGILAAWARDHGTGEIPWSDLYREVETLLSVSVIPEGMWSRHNRILKEGAEALGWAWGALSHNRTGCIGSGFCELGCAYDAKNNALKVLVPRIVKAGGEIFTHVQVIRVMESGREVTGVEAVVLDPVTREKRGRLTVRAKRVCLAGSATHTPAILLRSGLDDPAETTGRSLRIHPAVIVAGEFAEPVRAFEGTPQSIECTEWLDHETKRIWIVPAFGHPMSVATMLPGHGEAHRMWMERYAHMAVLTGMLHDHTKGQVTPQGDLDFTIDYVPEAADRKQLAVGLRRCAELLFAAGARRVLVPVRQPIVLGSTAECAALEDFPVGPDTVDLTAVHPMASVPMHARKDSGAVGTTGKHHHIGGLWVSDGSLFPTSIGAPPQLSIYALGLWVGRSLVAAK